MLSLVCHTRTLQDCSDRALAEPDMAANQPVAQTSLCQLDDLRRLAIRWTLSGLAAKPLTAGLGGGDAGLDALADRFITDNNPLIVVEQLPSGLSLGITRNKTNPPWQA